MLSLKEKLRILIEPFIQKHKKNTSVADFIKTDKKAVINFSRDNGYIDQSNNKALKGGYFFSFGNDVSNIANPLSQLNWNMTGEFPFTRLFDSSYNPHGYSNKVLFHNRNLDNILLQKIRIYNNYFLTRDQT